MVRISPRLRRLALLVPATLLLAVLAHPAAATSPESRVGKPNRVLRLVSTPWPPFTGEVGGARFATELAGEALDRAGVPFLTEIVPDAALTQALEDAATDGSAALWRTEQRERTLLYSAPYLENRLVLVAREGDDVSATSIEALTERRVAIVHGYGYGDAITGADGPVWVAGRTDEDNLRRLLAGEVDAMLVDELVVRHLLAMHPEEVARHLAIGDVPLLNRTLHLAVRRDIPGAERIVALFDAAIRKMQSDGTYNRILGMHWIAADVDGDGAIELVLRGERAGTSPPTDAYAIASLQEALRSEATRARRFVIGGEVYEDWNAVPSRYKNPHDASPSPHRETLFRFRF
jgi:ABC-type amino acid transport substrate-binding protein